MRPSLSNLSALPTTLRTLLRSQPSSSTSTSAPTPVQVQGWLKSIRSHKNVSFLEISDGTCAETLQGVLKGEEGRKLLEGLTLGISLKVQGDLRKGKGSQALELAISTLEVTGSSSSSYPIQKKHLPPDVLREHAHLRFRTSKDAAVVRVRDALMREWHDHFERNEYVHIHTPIMTSSDCEGAGETFRITTDPLPSTSASTPTSSPSCPPSPPSEPFFPTPTYLTVSSQLHLEPATHSLSRTYTLSPSFRAEPSATSRHLAEFYMLEAEVAFVEELEGLMGTVEEGIKGVLRGVLRGSVGGGRAERAREDLGVIGKSLMEDGELVTVEQRMSALDQMIDKPVPRITYTKAIEILQTRHSQQPFEYPPTWGSGLQSEHEKYIASEIAQGLVFITDYPQTLKPFYMRLNPPSSSHPTPSPTVACFDLLAPGIGELAGGSLREERLPHLEAAMTNLRMDLAAYEWYLDLRRYGSVKHGGWGMGFERFVCWVTGVGNVRDVVAYPRWKGHCKY